MKKTISILFIVIVSILFIKCSNSQSTGASNKYLKELPGIAVSYKIKLDKLKEERENARSVDESMDRSQEYKLQNKKADNAIQEELKKISLPVNIPFEGEINTSEYKLKNISITGAQFNQLEFTCSVIPKVTKQYLFGYVQLTDVSGKPLESSKDWAVLAVSNFRNVKEGEEIEMKGYYRGLEKLENFEKVVFKSRDEYKKNKY